MKRIDVRGVPVLKIATDTKAQALKVLEEAAELASARECCDACGREMTPADYGALHATVHVGMSFTIDGCPCMGDSWTLLCPDCYAQFREMFADFKQERAHS